MKLLRITRTRHEDGLSLLETVIAAAIMLVGIGGIMSLFTVAAMKNQSQGTQATRATEYAQDKMEQLMALSYTDVQADTTTVPTDLTNTSGVGTGLAVGGPAMDSTGRGLSMTEVKSGTQQYFDYISEGTGTGNAITTSKQAKSMYMRVWRIEYLTTSGVTDYNTKIITVSVRALNSADHSTASSNAYDALAPKTTLVSLRTNF